MSKRIHAAHLLTITLLVLLFLVYAYTNRHQSASLPSAPAAYAITAQTKTGSCSAQGGLPDLACTPGAINGAATKSVICVPGYSSSARNVTVAEKDAVYAEYSISSHAPGEYEVDHLISLELGGSNDIANLWPEAAVPMPGFHQKDEFENRLHAEMCAGSISLDEAQHEIASNWLQYYLVR